jgi:hypothetical protein
MARQHNTSRIVKSILAAALVGLSLLSLSGKLDGPSTQVTNSLLGASARVALELLPSVISAVWHVLQTLALDHPKSSSCPLQMLVSCWPLLRILARAA